ncbi:flavodoxin-dependent (E)-4-hydroxy-3-methylbut-2-enyl-diphosphate synthase [Yanshouia hominis]|uniref:4-hydroxy-3-methylbut-2-en-1-yl diphosphate synthase (flavodoxin) n=1 Tax=Yanshouia hominis TaxID=2763673 RepID=A0ABR7NGH9_9FIRM|nr:flavodoxin-dependent (E)-4-hydroxy-3-methylbut-2-enyl-diphosphate synthase [Yanshouia hominis]MBC8575513.1 flavodoxin-dependent (E)-4-hydroxy-3-methylbut-2-enyl-diphosphate synthase [Yanshouia hominis]
MRRTKQVLVGGVPIGGGAPVAIQSMLSVPAHDIEGNLRQAAALEAAGCRIIRAAVPDREAVPLIAALKEHTGMPVVADIHFDYRLALEAVAAGADKIRINPGNIGGADRVRAVANACNERKIPIRVGVNSGSVERELLARFGGPTAEAMVESAARHLKMLEEADFENTVLSLKSSDLKTMAAAYRLAAERFDCPLHLGVTEAGTERQGLVKSAIGIGALLLDGIGDTIRVSLTADPMREIAAAKDILRALGVKGCGAQIVSCPTCGRTRIDLIGLAHQVEEALRDFDTDCKVAVMGCAVNGPGEAREADLGVAGGDGCGVVFVRGRIVEKVPEEALLPTLLRYLKEWERTDGKLEL